MSSSLWTNTNIGSSHVDEIVIINDNIDDVSEVVTEVEKVNLKIELEIDNFSELTESEVIEVIQYTMQDLGNNIEIISIVRGENTKVTVEFRYVDFDEGDYLRRYYQEQYESVEKVASELRFPNCRAINRFFGKSEGLKRGDKRIGEEKCNICFCEYQEKELIRELPECKHSCHKKCLDKWLKKKAQCPMCRHNVLENKLKKSILKIAEEHGVTISN